MGRPKKEKKPISETPKQFEKDTELGLTEMQNAFVWHYTEGSCSQTEAARRAGYEFPAVAANKMLQCNAKQMRSAFQLGLAQGLSQIALELC